MESSENQQLRGRCCPDHPRASWKDQQTEVRTKLQDPDFDRLDSYAAARDLTIYQATRRLILDALARSERGDDAEGVAGSRDQDAGAPDRGPHDQTGGTVCGS